MNQADLGLNLSTKRTRKREFLEEMQTVVPWAELVGLIAPDASESKKGRPPYVRYRGLKRNTAQLITLFALSNLWMVRRKLLVLDGQICPKQAFAG